MSPLPRRSGYQIDILRQKEHDVDLSQHIQGPPGHTIEAHFSSQVALVCRPRASRISAREREGRIAVRPFLDQRDLQGMVLPRPGIHSRNACIGDDIPIRQPVDQLPFRRRQGRLGRGQEVDALQQVGLALSILPLHDGNARLEIDLQARIVAIVGEREMFQVHPKPNERYASA